MTPAKYLKDAAIAAEMKRLHKRWDSIDREGGGSPGEWMVERMGELEHEQSRRKNGGTLQTEIPMQSK